MLAFRNSPPSPPSQPERSAAAAPPPPKHTRLPPQHPLASRLLVGEMAEARGEVRESTAAAVMHAWQAFLASPFTRIGLVGLALSGIGAMSNGAGTTEPGETGFFSRVLTASVKYKCSHFESRISKSGCAAG